MSYYPPPDPEAAERTARHLAMCQELAELAMDLTRLTAQQAKREAAEPEAAALDATDKPAPQPRKFDTRLVFDRLARCVRQCLELEARLAEKRKPIADAEAKTAHHKACNDRAERAAQPHADPFLPVQQQPTPPPPDPAPAAPAAKCHTGPPGRPIPHLFDAICKEINAHPALPPNTS